MLIGAMNHPGHDVRSEIEWIAAMGLEFLDLTIEPPAAASWMVDPREVRALLDKSGLKVVGHTAFYLPLANPFEPVRRAAVEECIRCLEIFAAVGASWMNIHPDTDTPMHAKSFCMERNLKSLEEILVHARRVGVGIMVENLPGMDFNSVADIGALLEQLPDLALHLDVGHAHLSTIPHNAAQILEAYGRRLRHVHLHDNKGGTQDLHLGLGCGNVDVPGAVRALKACGYDGTITLEVFSPDRAYLAHSRDLLRSLWNSIS
jgi:sugar phosphate isomerase/epimerase